jgi:hypothetical protein
VGNNFITLKLSQDFGYNLSDLAAGLSGFTILNPSGSGLVTGGI